jgi:hypothetical protein
MRETSRAYSKLVEYYRYHALPSAHATHSHVTVLIVSTWCPNEKVNRTTCVEPRHNLIKSPIPLMHTQRAPFPNSTTCAV